jgi:hypothetical protein
MFCYDFGWLSITDMDAKANLWILLHKVPVPYRGFEK